MRILIVDDHRLFGDAIRRVLEVEGMDVVLSTSGAEALRELTTGVVDVVLLDLGLPDTTGMDLGRQIADRWPDVKLIIVTGLEDPRAVREAIQLGFHGYMTKDTPIPQFVDLLHAALGGQVVIPHRLARVAAGGARLDDPDVELLASHLTAREWDVLSALVDGMTSKEIQASLSISPNTLRTHVQSVLTKLQVHSRLEAAAFAVRYGLVERRQRRYA